MKLRTLAGSVGAVLLAAGCADLEIENPNAPDTDRVLAEPADVVNLIGNSYQTWWQGAHASFCNPAPMLSVAADAHSASWGNFYMKDFSSEPRLAIDNSPSFSYSCNVEGGWYQNYRVLKATYDGLRTMDQGLNLGQDEAMTRAFGKFMQGLAHGQLALLYDQAFVIDETVTLEEIEAGLELQPYDQVMAAAIGYLEEAIQLSSGASFTTPETWINGVTLTGDQLSQLAHSYIARYMAGVARTPAEREAVQWSQVIEHARQGITEDFGPNGEDAFWRGSWWDILKSFGGTFSGWGRLDLRFYGMADTDGDYQAWLALPPAERQAFLINTPDRRITGDTPTSNGTYVRYLKGIPFRPERGTWHFSNYADRRWAGGINDYSNNFVDKMIEFMPRELRLLEAEGLMRTGDPAAAAAIISETRVEAGLPPVTAAGVPQSADCVPHEPSTTKQCGSLLRALQWEKWVETYHTGMPTEFTDARGWGFLVSGTPIHLPIPGRELQVLELPIYTFGGEGGAGAAPSVGVEGGASFGKVSAAPSGFSLNPFRPGSNPRSLQQQ